MIVGFDATTLVGRLSGVGYYTARLMESLADGAGEGLIDAVVALSNRNPPVASRGRLRVHAKGRFPVRSVWMQLLLPRILGALKPDLVHYTNYLAPVAARVPYVVSVHDMTLSLLPAQHTLRKRLLTASLVPRVARGARLVLVPSESTRRDVVRLIGLDPTRVRVIPYAAGAGFVPAPDPALLRGRYGLAQPYFLYVGTLEPRKNLVRALGAFARAAERLPELQFVLVGQCGWGCAPLFEAMRRRELLGRVRQLGYVPEAHLPALYSGARAFVYPSLYEGFGLPVVEAMACGTPVVASRCSSLEEIGRGAARLVDPEDEAGLAEALHEVATDEALRARLVEHGRARAAEFSWQRTGRETAEAYREALERPPPA